MLQELGIEVLKLPKLGLHSLDGMIIDHGGGGKRGGRRREPQQRRQREERAEARLSERWATERRRLRDMAWLRTRNWV